MIVVMLCHHNWIPRRTISNDDSTESIISCLCMIGERILKPYLMLNRTEISGGDMSGMVAVHCLPDVRFFKGSTRIFE